MNAPPLFLSHWDASIPISVPAKVVEDLKNYHVMGVRFLYDCFRKLQKGAILNHEDGMNFPIQISAFLNALHTFITPESPVLIVCSEESLTAWHYHLTNHGGYDVTLLSTKNCEEILNGEIHRVILATVDSAKLLREIKESDFFAVVVEELDKVATKTIIKQLKSQFNIGLTNRNFLKNPDHKLFWTMLKWSNSEVVGKLDEFCEEDTNHLQNLRYPYGAWWQRLTWKFCDSFKVPSDEEQKHYKMQLKQWSNRNRVSCKDIQKSEPKRQTRKRKIKSENTIKSQLGSKEDEVVRNFQAAENPNASIDTFESTKNILNESNSKKIPQLNNSRQSQEKPNQNHSQNLNSSQDTIVYDFKNSSSDDTDDDNSILTSIMGKSNKLKVARMSFDEVQSDVKVEQPSLSKEDMLSMFFDEPKSESMDDNDDILTSIIKNKSVNTQSQNFENNSSAKSFENNEPDNSNLRKNEILSLLYGKIE